MVKKLEQTTYDEVTNNRIIIKLHKDGKIFLGSTLSTFREPSKFVFVDLFNEGNLVKSYTDKHEAIKVMKDYADIYVFDDIKEALEYFTN